MKSYQAAKSLILKNSDQETIYSNSATNFYGIFWGKIIQTNFFYYCALFRSYLSHEKFNPDNSSRWMHLKVPVSRYKSKCNETYLYLGTKKDIVRNYDNSISWYLTISVFRLNVNFLPFVHLYLSLSVHFSRLRTCS